MSSRHAFSFNGKWPKDNEVFGIKIPRADRLEIAVCRNKSTSIPLKVRGGVLTYANTESGNVHKVVDVVFKITGAHADTELETEVFKFLLKVKRCIATTNRHSAIRILQEEGTTVIVCRVFRNKDFTCQEHPELLLGTTPDMYRCQTCSKLLIRGMPHV